MVRRALGSSFVVFFSLGCSGSVATVPASADGGDDGSAEGAADAAPSITADQAAGDTAAAYCNRVQACAPAYVTLGYGDVATCTASLKTLLVKMLAANGATETPADVEACAAAIPMVSCGDFLSRKSTAACMIKPGTLADGTACGADSQCQGGRCRIPANQVCGQCGARAPAGAACGVDDDCDYGMKCVNHACVAYGSEGATCDATHPCRPDLGCVNGLCGTPAGSGAACASSAACDLGHAVVCNPATNLCDSAGFAAPNATCGLIGGHLTLCNGPGSQCAGITAPNYQGTCTTPASTGSPCDAVAGPLCGAGAVCVCSGGGDAGCPGTCQVPDPSTCH